MPTCKPGAERNRPALKKTRRKGLQKTSPYFCKERASQQFCNSFTWFSIVKSAFKHRRSQGMEQRYRRGDIYLAELRGYVDSAQRDFCPVIIIQNDISNIHSPRQPFSFWNILNCDTRHNEGHIILTPYMQHKIRRCLKIAKIAIGRQRLFHLG